MRTNLDNLLNSDFNTIVSQYPKSQIFVLVDENTKPLFQNLLECSEHLSEAEIIEIESGEEHKNIETVFSIWQHLSDNNVRRNSLFINLGGGVITDMGGFIAATYKRGIDFINIPTSLLAMIDAAIGGKTGIDLDNFKNQVGLFKHAIAVYCDAQFLKSLPEDQLISGFAEALKHGLVKDKSYWNQCIENPIQKMNWDDVIKGSIDIKSNIVSNDPTEKGERKLLNFGHTIGHALETHLLNSGAPILHGYAVAIGMICESHISYQKGLLSKNDLDVISNALINLFGKTSFETASFSTLLELMKNDKKNISNDINFSLLESIGSGLFDQTASKEEITSSLSYYLAL